MDLQPKEFKRSDPTHTANTSTVSVLQLSSNHVEIHTFGTGGIYIWENLSHLSIGGGGCLFRPPRRRVHESLWSVQLIIRHPCSCPPWSALGEQKMGLGGGMPIKKKRPCIMPMQCIFKTSLPSLAIFVHFCPHLVTFTFGSLSRLLTTFGRVCLLLPSFGYFWPILVHFAGSATFWNIWPFFWAAFGHFGPLLTTLGCFCAFWLAFALFEAIFGHLWPSLPTFVHFLPLLLLLATFGHAKLLAVLFGHFSVIFPFALLVAGTYG